MFFLILTHHISHPPTDKCHDVIHFIDWLSSCTQMNVRMCTYFSRDMMHFCHRLSGLKWGGFGWEARAVRKTLVWQRQRGDQTEMDEVGNRDVLFYLSSLYMSICIYITLCLYLDSHKHTFAHSY